MKYFQKIDIPVVENAQRDLNELLRLNIVGWRENQLCINSTIDFVDDFGLGVGSLDFDWNNKSTILDDAGNSKIIIPRREHPLKDSDFTVMCSQFKGTAIEELYLNMKSKFNIGRVRIMKSEPKTCLSWHVDHTQRIHYPIKTQPGCLMVIEDEVLHMPENTWWLTNTTVKHTAFNGSSENRIHLVGVIL